MNEFMYFYLILKRICTKEGSLCSILYAYIFTWYYKGFVNRQETLRCTKAPLTDAFFLLHNCMYDEYSRGPSALNYEQRSPGSKGGSLGWLIRMATEGRGGALNSSHDSNLMGALRTLPQGQVGVWWWVNSTLWVFHTIYETVNGRGAHMTATLTLLESFMCHLELKEGHEAGPKAFSQNGLNRGIFARAGNY